MVGNLFVFKKVKTPFSSLSLIMFSELYHGGLDVILAFVQESRSIFAFALTEATVPSATALNIGKTPIVQLFCILPEF